jgi:enoyl-CoA hydratase/carnithine racemase
MERSRRAAARAAGRAVQYRERDGVASITLARSATRNRLDAELMGGLVDSCAMAEDAEAVRVVILRGEGRDFSIGLPAAYGWPEPSWPDGIGAVARLTRPVIAALQGETAGWGLALALACDLRVAASTTTLALPELEQGRFPGGGATQRLTRMVGVARALELVLLGTRVPASTAFEWGLVSAVVAPARLASTVEEMAASLATRGPLALGLAKEAVVRALDLPLAEGIRLEQDLYVLLQTTADREEGIRAFLERRAPRFGGR